MAILVAVRWARKKPRFGLSRERQVEQRRCCMASEKAGPGAGVRLRGKRERLPSLEHFASRVCSQVQKKMGNQAAGRPAPGTDSPAPAMHILHPATKPSLASAKAQRRSSRIAKRMNIFASRPQGVRYPDPLLAARTVNVRAAVLRDSDPAHTPDERFSRTRTCLGTKPQVRSLCFAWSIFALDSRVPV